MQSATPIIPASSVMPTAGVPAAGVTFRFVYDLCLSGRKLTTIAAYAKAYERFASFIGAAEPLPALEALARMAGDPKYGPGHANAIAAAWRVKMVEQGYKAKTINMRLSAIRSFFSECKRFGLLTVDLDVQGMKDQDYTDTAGPRHEQFLQVLQKVQELKKQGEISESKAARDLALIRLMHDRGLRVSETVGLNFPEHFDPSNQCVLLLGKGRTDREPATIPQPTIDAIQAWLVLRGNATGPLFTNLDRAAQNAHKARRLSRFGAWKMIDRYGRMCGIDLWPHALRHSGATRVIEKTNGNAHALQQWGRWARLDTAQRYVDNHNDAGGEAAKLVAED